MKLFVNKLNFMALTK